VGQITFKSHQEPLDDWALKELTGHYVNYRKQCGPAKQPLLPEQDFQLYAVCRRYPHNLASAVTLRNLQEGVYACSRGTDTIRIIVAGQVPRVEHNALLHLFSASEDRVGYGADHYERHSPETSTLLEQLLAGNQGEGVAMSYTMADWRRDYITEHLKDLPAAERRKALQSLPPEELLTALSPEQLLDALSPEQIDRLRNKLQSERSARQRKPRRKN